MIIICLAVIIVVVIFVVILLIISFSLLLFISLPLLLLLSLPLHQDSDSSLSTSRALQPSLESLTWQKVTKNLLLKAMEGLRNIPQEKGTTEVSKTIQLIIIIIDTIDITIIFYHFYFIFNFLFLYFSISV